MKSQVFSNRGGSPISCSISGAMSSRQRTAAEKIPIRSPSRHPSSREKPSEPSEFRTPRFRPRDLPFGDGKLRTAGNCTILSRRTELHPNDSPPSRSSKEREPFPTRSLRDFSRQAPKPARKSRGENPSTRSSSFRTAGSFRRFGIPRNTDFRCGSRPTRPFLGRSTFSRVPNGSGANGMRSHRSSRRHGVS